MFRYIMLSVLVSLGAILIYGFKSMLDTVNDPDGVHSNEP